MLIAWGTALQPLTLQSCGGSMGVIDHKSAFVLTRNWSAGTITKTLTPPLQWLKHQMHWGRDSNGTAVICC